MKLLKNLATVSAFTFLSRILGYVRDRLLADIVGANAVADAFLFAWKLYLLRYIFNLLKRLDDD